ncbi:hypothetical protein [Roseovarius sp.]|uniref:hypothetical protein n=1 Tax=Roseovarius sp. TaxID=1486281 RepID=UPI0035631B9B
MGKFAARGSELAHPQAERLTEALAGLDDPRVAIEAAQRPGLGAVLRAPDGRKVML